MATIAEIHVYPVKSCRGFAADEWRLMEAGFEHDREWMVATPEGRFLTQRELPRMALIVPRLADDHLALTAPGRPDLVVPYELAGERRSVVVWRDKCDSLDQGEPAAQWLTDFLGRPVRLVRFAPDARRLSDPKFAADTGATTRFTDGYPLLAISRASFDDLNSRLPAPLPMDRFRPSIVIDGLPPYGEDELGDFHVGGMHLRGVKPCTRCVITSTRQTTGEVEGEEPLRTLKSYRWNRKLGGALFGQNVIVVGRAGGRVACGMALSIP